MKVYQALYTLMRDGYKIQGCGICWHVEEILGQGPALADWSRLHEAAFLDWPEFSGCPLYPVGPDEERAVLWYGRRNLWTGSYGNARRRLLRHLIIWFKERDL